MYEQIVDQIRQAIWSGDLPAGTPLPSQIGRASCRERV